MSDVAPETFATPDDFGPLHASELQTPLMESLGAQAADAFMGGTRTLMRSAEMFSAQQGVNPEFGAGATAEAGGPMSFATANAPMLDQTREVPIADAKARVKQEGLEGHLKLPEQDSIRGPVLDLMLAHAHERADYEAAVNRGPQNFAADALGFVTQMGVGMIDPVNIAAFSVPVLGEARYGQMLARAGDSLASRFALKAGIGAAQGAVGGTALLPADWWLRTQDGQDYTMADALKSVVLSAGMGTAFMGGHGTVSDLLARYRGLPLSGSPADLMLRGLARRGPAVAQPIKPLEEVPGITAAEKPLPAPLEAESAPEGPKGVFDDVLEQLRAAGMADEEAQQNAALVAARYETRAARMGGDAYDLYKGEGLTIQRPSAKDEEIEGRAFAQKVQEPGLFAEREAEGQQVLPGAERIGQGELAQRRADQALKPTKEQKPMDIGLFGDEANQKTLFQAPAFYSAAERAIAASRQEKASPEQWLATIKNTPGVKPEELHWLGLEDWLKEQKGPVTKQAIADYVRANQVELKEVNKGEPAKVRQAAETPQLREDWINASNKFSEAFDNLWNLSEDPAKRAEYERRSVEAERLHKIYQEHLDQIVTPETPTKFGSYTLPGGGNYREMLLTLPERRTEVQHAPPPAPLTELPPEYTTIHDFHGRPGEEWYVIPRDQGHARPIHGTWGPTEESAAANAVAMLNHNARMHYEGGIRDAERAANEGLNFKASHWEEPNVLAHVRFNDRTIDGKRTLFLEEIQSDWHQAGKRKGYRDEALEKHRDALVAEREALAQAGKLIQGHPEFAESQRRYEEINDELVRTAHGPRGWGDTAGGTSGGVPDAPFKTTWPELALKRMIRYAAENGYDKIAWTPGDVQAARYNLSKQIKTVRFEKAGYSGFTPADEVDARNSGVLVAIDHNGRKVIDQYVDDQSKLPDYVGKDVAEKLLAQKPQHGVVAGMSQVSRELTGLDLKVGGEGMAGFYDKILPAAASKLGKKFGAKVERRVAERPARERMPAEIEPGSAEAFEWMHDQEFGGLYLDERNGEWQVVDDHDDNNVIGSADTEHAARQILSEEAERRKPSPIGAHIMDLTPQLRDAAVRQGFPLFQGGDEGARGRITLQQNRAVIDLFANADRSTFVHEAGHLWLEEMVRDAGADNAPQGVKDDLATILNWLGVDKPEAIGTGQHEQFARGFEQYLSEGKAPSSRLAQAFEKFKDWLLAIYHGLASFGAPLSDDVRGVMDRMLATDKEIADWHNAPPHPAEVLADLPQAVQENVVQAAAADIINGRDVRAGEMLNEAGRQDPRIAESLEVKPAANVVRAPARKGPRARDPETYSLLEFLAANGGIRSDDPQIADLRTSFGRDNRFVPGFGNLIRKPRELSSAARAGGIRAPMSLDQAREAAVEAGYLHDEGRVSGAESTSTIEHLLQAVDEEARGHRLYRGDRSPQANAAAEAKIHEDNQRHADNELHEGLAEAGINPEEVPAARRARVLEIMAREGVADPMEAYERAVMEEESHGAQAGRIEQAAEKIPGWDDVDDGAAASGEGGPAAQESVAGGPGDSIGPRARGADAGSARQARDVEAWKKFGEAAPPVEDPDLAVASKMADKAPEPISIESDKAPSAAEAAANEANKLLDDILPRLSEDERKVFEDALNQMDIDNDTRAQICRDGAECLAAAGAEAAA